MQTFLFAKMQCACLAVLLFVILQHRKERYLPMSSSVLFKLLHIVSIINVAFDGITATMINVPQWRDMIWDRVAHYIFIGSLDLFSYVLCCYICSLIPVRKIFSKTKKMFRLLPLIASMLVLSFCFIEPSLLTYNTEHTICFSEGLCADTVYFGVAIYMCIDIYYLIRYREHLNDAHRKALIPSFCLMAFMSVLQLFNQEILMSGLGVTLLTLGLYLSLEDKHLVYNQTLKMFNATGFYRVYADYMARGKANSLVLLSICNTSLSSGALIRDEENEQMRKVSEALSTNYNISLFDVFPFHPLFFLPANVTLDKIQKIVNSIIGENDETVAVLKTIDSSYCKQNVNDMLLYVQHYIEEYERDVALYDIMTGTKNKNAFISEIKYYDNSLDSNKNLWFIMVDVNKLKTVNDSLGHMYGDKAIVYTAKALRKSFCETKEIYRIGGDEFVVVLKNTDEKAISSRLYDALEITKKLSMHDHFETSFSAGFAKFNPAVDSSVQDTIARADKMMYEQKYQYHRIVLQ